MITRIVTALLALPIFLFLIYLGGIYTSLLLALLILISIYELYRMMGIDDKISLLLLGVFALFLIFIEDQPSSIEILSLFALSLFLLFVKKYSEDHNSNKKELNNLFKSFFIYLYVAIPLSYILKIRAFEDGFTYLFFMFLIIWSTDTMAYFSGRAFGKHKLSPLISPNKTIEGSAGGSISAVVIALLFNKYTNLFAESSLFLLGLLIFLLTIISQIGDLFESTLKRLYNVKDSGKILPGHGGVLDRFDSTIFAAPFYYLIVKYLLF